MTEPTVLVPLITAAISAGIVAGVFFAFSTCVMRALARLPAEDGAAAMNAINITIINPMFMLVFVGTAALSLALAVGSLYFWPQPAAKLALAASTLYLVGSFGVTMAFNVPLNNHLAATPASNSAAFWRHYLLTWTRWNHVRTLASIAAALLFTISAVHR